MEYTPDIESLIIDAPALKKLIAEKPESLILLDVREPEEFAEDRLTGAKLIPLGDLMARASLDLDPDLEIIVYCAHGVRSMQALMGLRTLGFEKIRSLDGGLSAYRDTE
jgi:rhodanese-related sulfurtransferase